MTQPLVTTPASPATPAAPTTAPPIAGKSALTAPPAGAPPVVPPEKADLDKAEEAVRRARASAAQKRRETERMETVTKQLAEFEPDAKDMRELRKLATNDDLVGFLEYIGDKLKITPEKFVVALKKLHSGDYAADQEKRRLERIATEAAAEVKKLREELEGRSQQQVNQKAVEVLYELAEDEARYPRVAVLPKEIMHGEVEKILLAANEATKSPDNPKGTWYTFEDALGFLEKQLADSAARRRPVTTETQQQSEQDAATASKTTAAPPRAKTITSAMKSEAHSATPSTLPTGGKARIDHLTAVYRAALKK